MRTLVRTRAKRILHLTSNAILPAQQFSGHTHVTRGFSRVLRKTRMEIHVECHRYVTHVLNATNHVNVALTGHNAFSGIMQSLH